MNKPAVFLMCLGSFFTVTSSHAIDLKQSKVTQVVNDVQIISAADQKQKTASVNDIFAMPDILRTGPASRAELVAPDETITRVGANTIFSFDPANRTIDLKQGSLLFHSPHGKGGGTIHTGSATASVLGTTLIMVTTPQGGLKVIALEGEVEVKFLNGLKQKLDPGQMTFILPGANQLAPVIVFRLDELVDNSLLVKGFTQTLDSLPLIQNQIDKQLKLIVSGKATDTGLYAGDNASPNGVEVLDINTLPHGQQQQTPQSSPPPSPPPPPPPSPNPDQAERADATINQSSLTDASIPTPPSHLFTTINFPLTGNAYFGGQNFSGFVARNIYMNTPEVSLNPLIVDMSPYSILGSFDMVAVNNFNIEGSVTFQGLGVNEDLALIAGNAFNFQSGITLQTDAHNFIFSSPASMLFDNVSIYNTAENINTDLAQKTPANPAGNITFRSSADMTFQNDSLVQADGILTMNSLNNISVNSGSQLNSSSALITSLNGTINFDFGTLYAPNHAILIAPGGISLEYATLTSDYLTLSGTATAPVTIENSRLNAPNSLVVLSAADLNITGTLPPAARPSPQVINVGSELNANSDSGSVSLDSIGGSVNVSGTSITAHYLTINSGDGILLDASGHTLNATGSGATANFSAPNLITVRNADFTPFAVVNMAANTIVLANDIFASTGIYNFGTHTGSVLFNTQNPGGLAFYNCTLGGAALNNQNQINFIGGPGNTAGIYSYAK